MKFEIFRIKDILQQHFTELTKEKHYHKENIANVKLER